MPAARQTPDAPAGLPDPGEASTLDDLVERLRSLKVWAGDPSYESIKDRVNAAWLSAGRPAAELVGKTTVVDCFRPGRRRLNADLVESIAAVLCPDLGYVAQWRQALQVISGQTRAAFQVRVHDTLPAGLTAFTGRTAELDQILGALRHGSSVAQAVVVSGMAGIGKTQLAIHSGHMLLREKLVDRVLFVNLRGFHPDPTQPAADPAAVLDGFLRLLGVPGHQIPHDLPARTAAYRSLLAGNRRTLIVLDNAADEEQVRPLMPETAGCLVLVTSRRRLTGLRPTAHVTMDVFGADDAVGYLTRAAPEVPVGPDPDAARRIARRCGYLPLALGLIAGQLRARAGWTLTDHADRIDERHQTGHLHTGVELALDLSYRQLTSNRQRLFRLLALHPGQDFDAYAAAALTGGDLRSTETDLEHLHRDNLLQPANASRYTCHDLVHAYAAERARDEDPPPARRAALTRLFDYYLATAAAAMDLSYPAEIHRRPRIQPATTPAPSLSDEDTARAWLDTERPTLVAVAAHTAGHGWASHTTRLSTTLYRYLNGGYHSDALALHSHALRAADTTADLVERAHVLVNLGATLHMLGEYEPAAQHLRQALAVCRRAGDLVGQARAHTNLGNLEAKRGNLEQSARHHTQAGPLYREGGDLASEAGALANLGEVEALLGHLQPAIDHFEQALARFQHFGDRTGEAWVLTILGDVETQLDRYESADAHFKQALALAYGNGDRTAQARTLDYLGTLQTRRGQPARAADHLRQAVTLFREIGERDGEASALNGLGETASATSHPAEALTHHTAAHAIAAAIGEQLQHARAHAGLGRNHHDLGDLTRADRHYRRALTLYTDLGTPEAEKVRAQLATIENNGTE